MAKAKQRRLGRGLSSLISEPAPIEATPAEGPETRETPESGEAGRAPQEGGVHRVPLDAIVPNRYQPRQEFDEESLRALASSIRTAGVMQPIAVRPLREEGEAPAGARWELIAGERRWRAARLAGLDAVPAVVADLGDQEAAEWSLVENLQREDLNPMDRARAFRRLQEEFALSPGRIAERVSLDRSTVANLIRLTELEAGIQERIAAGGLSPGHGKALLGVEAGERRRSLAKRAEQGGWSVRKLEAAVNGDGERASTPAKSGGGSDTSQAARQDLEERLGKHLGTRVQIRTGRSATRGHLRVEFFDLDHFDDLLSRFGYEPD